MRRPRLVIAMVLVVLVGTAGGAFLLRCRSVELWTASLEAEETEADLEYLIPVMEEIAADERAYRAAGAPGLSADELARSETNEAHAAASAAHFRLLKEHHARLKLKYRSASARPWLPVAADPPAPAPEPPTVELTGRPNFR
jgi:hypothetical protein